MSFRKSISRHQADVHFSYCIRAAQGWVCQSCGKDYKEEGRDKKGIQCSHYIGRGNWAVRFDYALCLCSVCHGLMEANPPKHTKLFTEHIGGESELEKYIQRSECKHRAQWARANKDAISKFYLAERKRIDSLREQQAKEGKSEAIKVRRYDEGPAHISDPGHSGKAGS